MIRLMRRIQRVGHKRNYPIIDDETRRTKWGPSGTPGFSSTQLARYLNESVASKNYKAPVLKVWRALFFLKRTGLVELRNSKWYWKEIGQ